MTDRMRTLLDSVDFPEPRHDIEQTIRLGRRRRATRWTAVAATGAAVIAATAVAVTWTNAPGPGRTAAGPARTSACEVEHLTLPDRVRSATAVGVAASGRHIIGATTDNRTILWSDGRPKVLDAAGPEAVNDAGTVVGTRPNGSAWAYRDGAVTTLPLPAGGSAGQLSINAAGDIAGSVSRPGTHAVPIVWPADTPGQHRLLNSSGAATVRAISDGRVVVGSVAVGGSDSTMPYRWDAAGSGDGLLATPSGLALGSVVDLAGNWATGLLRTSAGAMNHPPGGIAAARWNLTTGEVTLLGIDALPAGVDATGQVLIPENPPRLVGLDRTVLPLPVVTGFRRTVAADVSDNGIVVGTASTDTGSQPIRWQC